jgi:hypothetical protein
LKDIEVIGVSVSAQIFPCLDYRYNPKDKVGHHYKYGVAVSNEVENIDENIYE